MTYIPYDGGKEIEHPEAYGAAIKRNMIANARKTWLKNQERATEIDNWIDINVVDNKFAKSLFDALANYGKLSPKQSDAVLKIIDGDAAKKAEWAKQREIENANAEPIVAGKQVITGEVMSLKTQYSQYGEVTKMLVKDDRGFKVFGTVPQAIWDAAYELDIEVKGQRVQFTATVEASKDDNKFGFFKRPTKSQLTNEV
jgi:hypothetical protein